jgi:hypothetical protein
MDPPSVGDASATILIDGRAFDAAGPSMTGAQILALAGRNPEDTVLYAEGHRGQRIRAQEEVPVQDGGRFRTAPRAT